VGDAGSAMILLELTRVGCCEGCGSRFFLPPGSDLPSNCPHCGSKDWLYGRESIEGIRIRTGMTFAPRRPDGRRDRRKEPGQGPRSLLRRERARRQGQAFQPKAVDEPAGT
jgi:predicted  nucleic acid-binding Zn-ribbon protein